MYNKNVTVNLSANAEERPIAFLVQIASKYESKIYLNQGSKKINAKSIMGMMSLGYSKGEKIQIEADGNDEVEAVEEMAKYIQAAQ